MSKIDTTIDILSDSVVDIQAKLFYEATDGKVLVNGWETPMPAALQVLSSAQANEWGMEAMKTISSRVSIDSRRMGAKQVSYMARYAQRSSADPFHGYRSDPPKARAFRMVDPIGPVATAIKAAGELAAVVKHRGESDDKVWKILEGSWGVNVESLKDFVTPDTSESSEKDMIKFVRSPSHMLYGFNNHSPSCTIDLGKYAPRTMEANYLFDWHSFALALRFQGEYFHRYQGGFRRPGRMVAYCPANEEGNIFTRTMVVEGMSEPVIKEKPSIINEIAKVTMAHYEGYMCDFGARTNARLRFLKTNISSEVDVDIAVINRLAANKSRLNMHLDKSFALIPSGREPYDIKEEKQSRFTRSVLAAARRFGAHYIPTWKSVHAMVWEVYFSAKFAGYDAIVSFIRKSSIYDSLGSSQKEQFKTTFVRRVPKEFGDTFYLVLDAMSPSREHAQTQFFDMIMHLSDNSYKIVDADKSTVYISAIFASTDFKRVLKAVHSGFTRCSSFHHSAGKIVIGNKPGLTILENMAESLNRYMFDRRDYWAAHYESRVFDYKYTLAEISTENKASGRKLKWVQEIQPYFDVKAVLPDLKNCSDEMLVKYHSGCRYGMVTYAFLAKCYRSSSVSIDNKLNVTFRIRPANYIGMMKNVVRNYIRKRTDASYNRKSLSLDIDAIFAKVQSMSRIADVNNYLDDAINPMIKWRDLYSLYTTKAIATEKSISYVLKKRLHNDHEADVNIDEEETEAHECGVMKPIKPATTITDNAFAALNQWDESSEETSTDSDIVIEKEKEVSDEKPYLVESSFIEEIDLKSSDTAFTAPEKKPESLDISTGFDFGGFSFGSAKAPKAKSYDSVNIEGYIKGNFAELYDPYTYNDFMKSNSDLSKTPTVGIDEIEDVGKRYLSYAKASRKGWSKVETIGEGNVDIV